MFSPELFAIAPDHADAMRSVAKRRKRLQDNRSGGVVGIVELLGPLDKPALAAAREAVHRLAGDDLCGEIVLLVDSPGGTVAGTNDLSLAIAEAAEEKRVTAVIEDLAASAAYWAISGATEIVVNPTGKVGGIGVFAVLTDASRLLEKTGIDILVIRSGKHKGAGEWGAKISAEQIAELQGQVDEIARHFVVAIARGRHLATNRVADIADGRIFIGNQAKAVGLVDRIATIEQILKEAALRQQRLIYAQLDVEEALAKFDELSAAWITQRGYVPVSAEQYMRDAAERKVAEQYPELAAKAAAIRSTKRVTDKRLAASFENDFYRNGGASRPRRI